MHTSRVGQNRIYISIHTVYDRIFRDFSVNITVYTPCIYGSGLPYVYVRHRIDICSHTRTHTICTQAHTHASAHTLKHNTHEHALRHTAAQFMTCFIVCVISASPCVPTKHARNQTHTHARTHTNTHARTHTCTHTRTHAHTPGFNPLGHTAAQFMMVLHRYSLYASSSCARRSLVASSRLSITHLRQGGGAVVWSQVQCL